MTARGRSAVSEMEVLRKRGTLHILRQPPPESLSAGFMERLRAVGESLLP